LRINGKLFLRRPLYYAPMDATQYFQSNKIHCDQCLTKNSRKEFHLEILNQRNEAKGFSSETIEAFENGKSVYKLIDIKEDSYCQLLFYKNKEAKALKIAIKKIDGLQALLKEQSDNGDLLTAIFDKITAYEIELEKKKPVSYSHQALQIGIMHPSKRQVIPLMPEEIRNTDGTTKQDCEMNAAKRLLSQVRKDHRQLGLIIGGDALFSKQPIIEDILGLDMHYLFVAKPTDHIFMTRWMENNPEWSTHQANGIKGRQLRYRWMNDVPLNGNKETVKTNYLYFEMVVTDDAGKEKIVFKSSWVTDIEIDEKNVAHLVAGGRCRWKVENEMFNTLKNQGYALEHSYGHGKGNLCYNFYLLTLLAFFFHQIFELTDKTYQACRIKFGSKKHMWESLRAYIKILIFESWQQLMDFALKPTNYLHGESAEITLQAV